MNLRTARWFKKWGITRERIGAKMPRWAVEHVLHSDLWLFRRDSVARAWFFGWIVLATPLIGLQTFLTIPFILRFRCNVPVIVSIQWVTNPLTAIPFYYLTYNIGCFVLGRAPLSREVISEAWSGGVWNLVQTIGDGVIPLFLGGLILGVIMGSLGYFLIRRMIPPASGQSSRTTL
ncbi:MAG: DUF2062 domain-containing protein [Verrucomicrobiae bacterium]|nr:DUF2062 domain-containing protein [Verrucomicrobiae bacterium]